MESDVLPWTGTLDLAVTVTNAGPHLAEELVQLYIHDRVASLTQPGRLLKDFKRVTLKSGESQKVRFTLNARQLGFIGADETYRIEPPARRLAGAPCTGRGHGDLPPGRPPVDQRRALNLALTGKAAGLNDAAVCLRPSFGDLS